MSKLWHVEKTDSGSLVMVVHSPLTVEDFNAAVDAARSMLESGVGGIEEMERFSHGRARGVVLGRD